MEKSLEDKLYDSVIQEDQDAVLNLVSQGANPNKISCHGKTSLGEAAKMGNKDIVKLLIDACTSVGTKKLSTQGCTKKRHSKSHKRKLKSTECEETVVKCKNFSDRTFKESQLSENDSLQCRNVDKNQGYFVFIHSEASSSDESKMAGGCKSPVSPSSSASTPQADLEWDEEIVNVAPTTSEDETWSSMYKWYAAILECTGAAIASASVVTNGIDQQDAYTRTALHYAAEQGHSGVVRLILDAESPLCLPESISSCLRPSLFPRVPPYLKFVGHDETSALKIPMPIQKHLKWKLTTITPIVVKKTLTNSGFRLVKSECDTAECPQEDRQDEESCSGTRDTNSSQQLIMLGNLLEEEALIAKKSSGFVTSESG